MLNNRPMNMDEIMNELQSRLEYIKKEIEYRKNDLGDPIHYHHYCGFLEAADGTFGERQFLEKILGV